MNSEGKVMALKIAAWIWVGLAVIFAIGCLSDGLWLGAIAFLVSAIAAAPLMAPFFDQKVPAVARRIAGVVAAVVGFLIIGASAAPPAPAPSADGTSPAPAASSSAVAGAQSNEAKLAFEELYRNVIDTIDPCDKSNARAAKMLQTASKGGANVYDAYGEAKRAHGACEIAWSKMGDVEVPAGITGELRGKAEEAVDRCKSSTFARMQSLETMMEVLDGEARPSKVQEFQEQAQAAGAGALSCVASLYVVGSAVGADMEKLAKSME